MFGISAFLDFLKQLKHLLFVAELAHIDHWFLRWLKPGIAELLDFAEVVIRLDFGGLYRQLLLLKPST